MRSTITPASRVAAAFAPPAQEAAQYLCTAGSLIGKRRVALAQERGAFDQLQRTLASEKAMLDEARTTEWRARDAETFLRTEIVERRKQAIDSIERMASAALQQIYGPGHFLRFETGEEKRKVGEANFRMEIKIVSPHEGEDLVRPVIGHHGGGAVDTVAFALRMACLTWLRYEGPVLLDEAYKAMSEDEKVWEVTRFLRDVTDLTDRQVVFVTHLPGVFGEIADRVHHVRQDNKKVSHVEWRLGQHRGGDGPGAEDAQEDADG